MSDISGFVIENGVLVKYTGFEKEVTVPDGVTVIGKSAFEDCYSLENINLPKSLKDIEVRAFKNCQHLKSMDIPSGVRFIFNEAFYGCEELAHVGLTEGLVLICESAFESCSSLEEIVIPDYADISAYSFCYCTSLQRVVLPENGLMRVPRGAFAGCSDGIGSVHLGESVIMVESGAFESTPIFDLYIGSSVTNIENGAFSGVFTVTYNGDEYAYASLCADLDGHPLPYEATYLKSSEDE